MSYIQVVTSRERIDSMHTFKTLQRKNTYTSTLTFRHKHSSDNEPTIDRNSENSLIYIKFMPFVMILIIFVAATLRVSGCLEKSTEVMKSMQDLINVPEVMGIARELSKEMMKVSTVSMLKIACRCVPKFIYSI